MWIIFENSHKQVKSWVSLGFHPIQNVGFPSVFTRYSTESQHPVSNPSSVKLFHTFLLLEEKADYNREPSPDSHIQLNFTSSAPSPNRSLLTIIAAKKRKNAIEAQ